MVRYEIKDHRTTQDPDPALIDSIRISYQPIVRLDTLSPAYFEVLARTADEAGTLHGPQPLIAAMDTAEHSLSLSAHIIGLALAEHPSFTQTPPCTLAFNLPLDALLHPALMDRIEASRAAAGINPMHIQFELTETHPVTNLPATGQAISRLRTAGFNLALDDVTPAMHNLCGLVTLPVTAFKLDQSVTNATDAATARFIGDLAVHAHARGQIVIAEGIETEQTLGRMRALGVTHGQGFLFAAAMPAGAVSFYVAAQRRESVNFQNA
jgi:EAL domain-containing protein (putative c-di-GMP-specific phosphodiesterase class I)